MVIDKQYKGKHTHPVAVQELFLLSDPRALRRGDQLRTDEQQGRMVLATSRHVPTPVLGSAHQLTGLRWAHSCSSPSSEVVQVHITFSSHHHNVSSVLHYFLTPQVWELPY